MLRKNHLFYAMASVAILSALPTVAHAQGSSPPPATSSAPREQILGWDSARSVMIYVERTPSGVVGFSHVSTVEVPRGPGGQERRVRLTTDVDVDQVRNAQGMTRENNRRAIEARVQRDLDAARTPLEQGSVQPVSARGAVPGGARGCQSAPYAAREFDVGSEIIGRAEPAADGMQTSITLAQRGRRNQAVLVPSITVASGSQVVRAPYDVIADVRELPGTDVLAVLLRSDACTPEGSVVPARAVLVPAPPPPEQPLTMLNHAELTEVAVMRAIAPGARRRTVDEVDGWFEGRSRVVFDTAWEIPNVPDRYLIQFSRHGELSPLLTAAGQAPATFGILERRGSRYRLVHQYSPGVRDNVYEGLGQEAYSADLDGDGTPEVLVRSRFNRDDEVASLLRVQSDQVQFVWRGLTRVDERQQPTGPTSEVRRCNVGVDGRVVVLRCNVETHRGGASAQSSPTSRATVIQRLRWNGGVVEMSEERR